MRLLRFDGSEEYVIDDTDELEGQGFYLYIYCYDCNIDFCLDLIATPKEVVQAWNKRVYPEKPKVSGWIPCSERFPEKNGKYLVTYCDDLVENYVIKRNFYNGRFEPMPYSEKNLGRKVLAWQQLPEPYKVK